MGHSFIARLQSFLQRTRDISNNLNLSEDQCTISYSGYPGGTVAKFRLNQLQLVVNTDIVVLQIGSNDLCARDKSPISVTNDIIQLCDDLHNIHGVRHIIIMQLLKRHTPRNPAKNRFRLDVEWYASRVSYVNQHLSAAMQTRPHGTYWKHKGLYSTPQLEAALMDDGVHLNSVGYRKYFNNIRASLVTTLRQL